MEPGPYRRAAGFGPQTGPTAMPGLPGPDDPLAVVAVGPGGAGRRELLAALLGTVPELLTVPEGSYLVLDHAEVPTRAAYVPGHQQPQGHGADRPDVGPASARPPRRVELAIPDPLLRHFLVIDTPDTDRLGPAGARVLADVVRRAGALLWVTAADQTFSGAELDLLAEVAARQVAVLFMLTPCAAGWHAESAGEADDPALDPVAIAVDAHRATLLSAVPSLAAAPWLALDGGGTGALKRTLVHWAAEEGLRRASSHPPVLPGTGRRIPVVPGAENSDWAGRLDREVRCHVQRIRQDLALELANLHLRVVQEIVFGVGCTGLAQLLDRELQALSLLATDLCDRAVNRLLDDSLVRVFGGPADEEARRRLIMAVRWGLTEQPAGYDLDRVLLVTGTGGVATLVGPGAGAALVAFVGAPRTAVLPAVGLALSGGCYQHWRKPGEDGVNRARTWTQRALRETELELQRLVARRFEAFRVSLATVLGDAVDHGILLA